MYTQGHGQFLSLSRLIFAIYRKRQTKVTIRQLVDTGKYRLLINLILLMISRCRNWRQTKGLRQNNIIIS